MTYEEQINRLDHARTWARGIYNTRAPGVAYDLANALIGLANDHSPWTYTEGLDAVALDDERIAAAYEMSRDIARLIRKADALQPQAVRETRDAAA